MSHFAQVIDGVVQQVIVAEQPFIDTLPDPQNWLQTSYNTYGGIHYKPNTIPIRSEPSEDQSKALRKNYASVGYTYDVVRDAFIPPKKYESWTLNETTCLWEPPTPMPEDGNTYYWDESTLSWKLLGT
jgi:hypothetical protein